MLKSLFVGATTIMTLTVPLVDRLEARQVDYAAAVQTPPAAPAAAGQAAPNPTARQPPQFVSIRLELSISISDSRGSSLAPTKAVTMYLVDRDGGRLRIGAGANSAARSAEGVPTVPGAGPMLNVDALPEVLTNGKVRVSLTLEYRPARSESDKMEPIHINERVSAILEDGKPTVVSQTADPASDRVVKVELKATIVR
jgi:hypothetical protein